MNLAIRRGIFNALKSDAGIKALVSNRVYYEQAPEGAVFPYVIFSKAVGTKVRALQAGATLKHDVWLVKGIDRNSSADTADKIADAIDAALDEKTFTVEGGTVIDLHHRADVTYVENDGDQQYRHSGAEYGIVIA